MAYTVSSSINSENPEGKYRDRYEVCHEREHDRPDVAQGIDDLFDAITQSDRGHARDREDLDGEVGGSRESVRHAISRLPTA